MKQGKNLIVVLLAILVLLTACGNNTVSQEPVNQPPMDNNHNLEKGKIGEAMLNQFKENKEIRVAINLQPFILDMHKELRFVPDLVDNQPNVNMSLQVYMPEYDIVGVGAIGFVYVGAGEVGRLSIDSNFLAEKMMESEDLLYSLNSNKYAGQFKGFTISSQKAKAILNIRDVAAQAIRDGKVVTK